MSDFIVPNLVDAFCTHCRREVVVGPSRACPDCGQQVDPRSLPRATSKPVLKFERAELPDPAPKPPVVPIELPDWIEEARWWGVATLKLADALAKEEQQLVGELRRVRALRQLIDQVRERVTLPDTTSGG